MAVTVVGSVTTSRGASSANNCLISSALSRVAAIPTQSSAASLGCAATAR